MAVWWHLYAALRLAGTFAAVCGDYLQWHSDAMRLDTQTNRNVTSAEAEGSASGPSASSGPR